MQNIKTTAVTKNQLEKIEKNVDFIQQITDAGQKKGYRIIIAGGYAVDGALGEITRNHNDIDIQIYGKTPEAKQAIHKLFSSLAEKNSFYDNLELKDKGRKEYYHNFLVEKSWLGADIYYLQVITDPFDSEKIIVKKEGSLTPSHPYNTRQGKLLNVTFEIQNPLTELTDKLMKREKGEPYFEKHDQDIYNLNLLTNK